MKRQVLIIEAPRLSDESVASLVHFVSELMSGIESHYYHQLQRYYRHSTSVQDFDDQTDDENPF